MPKQLWQQFAASSRLCLSTVDFTLKAASVVALLFTPLNTAFAQPPGRHAHANMIIPRSSQSPSAGTSATIATATAHTNIRFLSSLGLSPSELPPYSGYAYETPASLACVYGLTRYIPGCNPNETTTNSSGGSQTIAIVDAYDDPNAAADLAFFSAQFGLPFSPSNFQVVYAAGAEPPEDPTGGWELEEALDIEYAHAMAPNAKIYLVEANSNFDSDLFPAVLVASNLVRCGSVTTCPTTSKGQGQVSMSWSGSEFSQESELDSFFTTPGVVYYAASGDAPGVGYPCASPNVVCAGGTSISRSDTTGNMIAEIGWSEAGGGVSSYEPIPSYQSSNRGIASQLGGYRGVPDISANANPDTGAWVWTTFPYEGSETGWFIVGGTSLATPLLSGIFNSTGNFGSSSASELSTIYNTRNFASFRDIFYGACGYYSGTFANLGWDLCTGVGSPNKLKLK